MTRQIRFARNTTVADCQALLAIEPLLTAGDADILDIVRSAANQPSTRLIGVVDGDGRLVGVIPVARVAESVVARAVPESLLIDVSDSESAARFTHSLEDRVASDIMLPPATAVPSDTIGTAFRLMHERRLGGLYIVDTEGRPTGYLDLLELAIVYVRALAQGTPADGGTAGAASDRTS